MKRHILWLALLMSCLLFADAFAHPGDVDANGGHYDYSTGEYHYHHGYPAHSHKNDTCPYDFDDRTGENSGTPGGISISSWYTTAPRPYSSPMPITATRPMQTKSFLQRHPLLVLSFILILALLIWIFIGKKKEEEQRRIEQEQYEKERQEAIAYYSSRNLRYLTGMPDMYYVDDQLVPYEYNKPRECRYGITLDIYVTHGSSDVYHRKGCRHLSYHSAHNACSEERLWHFSRKRPCAICKPDPLPDFAWYKEYLQHIERCKKYGITPKLNPSNFEPPPPPQEQSPAPSPVAPPPSHTTIPTVPIRPPRRSSPVPVHNSIPEKKPVVIPPPTLTPPASAPPTSTIHLDPEPTAADIPDCPRIYRNNYPATWAYIQRYAGNAEDYVYYYHFVWGKLQEHHGDGIIYGSLSEDQQKLVNYLPLGNVVYLSSTKSDKYHATPECYSLLKSSPFAVKKDDVLTKQRCTKCVPPN